MLGALAELGCGALLRNVGLLPEREPDEPPATESQIAYLKTITRDLDEGEIRKLGMKQVSVLIDKTKVKRDAFTNELIAKRLAQKSGCMSSILLLVVLYALILIFI